MAKSHRSKREKRLRSIRRTGSERSSSPTEFLILPNRNSLRFAGITIRMVTGDNINTAKTIAREYGILADDGIAIEGPVFQEMSFEELNTVNPKIQLMPPSSPLVKHLRTTFCEVLAVRQILNWQ